MGPVYKLVDLLEHREHRVDEWFRRANVHTVGLVCPIYGQTRRGQGSSWEAALCNAVNQFPDCKDCEHVADVLGCLM